MTTLTLEIKNDSLLNSIKIILSSMKGVKIKEYNTIESNLIDGLKEVKVFEQNKKKLTNARDFLKTL